MIHFLTLSDLFSVGMEGGVKTHVAYHPRALSSDLVHTRGRQQGQQGHDSALAMRGCLFVGEELVSDLGRDACCAGHACVLCRSLCFIFSRSSIITVVCWRSKTVTRWNAISKEIWRGIQKPRHLKSVIIESIRNARCGLQIWLDICYSISSHRLQFLMRQTLPSSNLGALII
jgi:hypothetical protein